VLTEPVNNIKLNYDGLIYSTLCDDVERVMRGDVVDREAFTYRGPGSPKERKPGERDVTNQRVIMEQRLIDLGLKGFEEYVAWFHGVPWRFPAVKPDAESIAYCWVRAGFLWEDLVDPGMRVAYGPLHDLFEERWHVAVGGPVEENDAAWRRRAVYYKCLKGAEE
jgi:hypothetical protein